MKKRILILTHDNTTLSDDRCAGYEVLCTSDPSEALSLVMGGSSAFGADYYTFTGKIRPALVVVDEHFLEKYAGIEFLEILRKYYTLKSVKVYILCHEPETIDPVIIKKYGIAGQLTKPLNVEALASELGESPRPTDPSVGSPMLLAFFTTCREKVRALSIYCVSAVKLTCLAATVAMVSLVVEDNSHAEHKMPLQIQINEVEQAIPETVPLQTETVPEDVVKPTRQKTKPRLTGRKIKKEEVPTLPRQDTSAETITQARHYQIVAVPED